MKNKTSIVAALVLSAAVAGSVFAGVKAQDDNQTGSAAAKTQGATMQKKTKTKKHHKAKHAKKMKTSKTMTPSTKK